MRKRELALAVGAGVGAAVAIKMLTRPRTIDWNSVSSSIPNADRSRFITVDGIRLHYQTFGHESDSPMFLIHGYTSSLYVWKTAAPRLAEEGFFVIAVDLVGFGYSEKPSWFDYTINSQARIIERMMDRLGIGRATVVGSSYGGAVAATLALDYPGRVEKLVLVDAVINDNLKSHPLLRLASVPGIGETLTPFLLDSRSFIRFRMRHTIAKPNHHLISEERLRNVQRPLKTADAHHSVLATSRNWHADRIERDANLIGNQTLIIWGDQDTVIPIENGYKLYDSILHSRLVVLKNCGHVPQEEKSQLFARLVADFCHDRKGHVETKDPEFLLEPTGG